jgi:hypothetical protein
MLCVRRRLAILLAILQAWPAGLVSAGEFRVFRKTYTRSTSSPSTETDRFSVLNPSAPWKVRLTNGGPSADRVSSASVDLNGRAVVEPRHLNLAGSRV